MRVRKTAIVISLTIPTLLCSTTAINENARMRWAGSKREGTKRRRGKIKKDVNCFWKPPRCIPLFSSFLLSWLTAQPPRRCDSRLRVATTTLHHHAFHPPHPRLTHYAKSQKKGKGRPRPCRMKCHTQQHGEGSPHSIKDKYVTFPINKQTQKIVLMPLFSRFFSSRLSFQGSGSYWQDVAHTRR